MSLKTILKIGVGGLILTACATQPEPAQEVIEVVETPQQVFEPVPPPVAPPAPVTAPVDTTPTFIAPTAGSLDDFLYQSGGDGRVYFGYDQSTLSDTSRDVLRRQANWLNTYSNITAVIEGNADERGTREYNLALGARRASSVKAFLVSQGVAPNRLTTVSYGKERPIDAGSNEQSWSRNRNGNTNVNVANGAG
ncbi:MAG: peptidoglycan-associated lipoprotein Pal [Maricaulaceae bacterium]